MLKVFCMLNNPLDMVYMLRSFFFVNGTVSKRDVLLYVSITSSKKTVLPSATCATLENHKLWIRWKCVFKTLPWIYWILKCYRTFRPNAKRCRLFFLVAFQRIYRLAFGAYSIFPMFMHSPHLPFIAYMHICVLVQSFEDRRTHSIPSFNHFCAVLGPFAALCFVCTSVECMRHLHTIQLSPRFTSVRQGSREHLFIVHAARVNTTVMNFHIPNQILEWICTRVALCVVGRRFAHNRFA